MCEALADYRTPRHLDGYHERGFMSYTLTKSMRFEASHQLLHHDGKCARLHGHSWKLIVEIQGDELHEDGPQRGMLLDYGRLKKSMKRLHEDLLDHHHLNDTLDTDSPTSEEVARQVFERLADDDELMTELENAHARLVAVTVEETCTSSCRYQG